MNHWSTNRHLYNPTTDCILACLGLEPFYRQILEQYIHPILAHCYHYTWAPEELLAENFIAMYRPDQQPGLGIHNDDSWISSVICLLYTSPSPRDVEESRMPSSA